MIRYSIFLALSLLLSTTSIAQGYAIGDEAAPFSLQNIDDKMVSLSDYATQKGVIVIFTCNHCPFSVAYEDRIIALDEKYKALGFPVVAINPNDAEMYLSDSFEEMKIRAKDKGFTFPYLIDSKQDVFPEFGATKTPHVFLLNNQKGKFIVEYIGAIDNNTEDASKVTEHYLSDALDALLEGKTPPLTMTKAIGCSIKVKK